MSSLVATQLRPGDRVVFLGDSITQAGARPGGYVYLFREGVDRAFPDGQVDIIGAGFSGYTVPDCQKRLERDVLALQPTHVVMYVGLNDVWYETRGQGTSNELFRCGLKDLAERCQSLGAKVFLCTPSVIGEKIDGSNSYDQRLEEFAAIAREVAQQSAAELIDLRRFFMEHLCKINAGNKPHSVLTTDGVHLNAMGNRFVADCMLKAFGVESPARPQHVLRHIVLLKFKREVTAEQIRTVDEEFRALRDRIPEVLDIEAGVDNSPEGLSHGFTHAFVVTFRGENERAIYLPHPEHQRFVSLLKPHMADVLVLDFWAERSSRRSEAQEHGEPSS